MKSILYQSRMKSIFMLSLLLLLGLSTYAQTTFPGTITHDGLQRRYLAFIPSGYNPAQAHELVFVLHGGGGNAQRMFMMTRFDQVADTANFILVFPQGVFSGLDGSGNPEYHWADGRQTTVPDTMGVDDVGFISALIDTFSANYNIDADRIYAAGVSNGGYMSQRLACGLSDRLAAVATVAATFPDSVVQECNNATPLSILIMNGTADALVPTYTGGMASGTGGWVLSTQQMIAIWLSNNSCTNAFSAFNFPNISTSDNSWVRKFTYSTCSTVTELQHYKIFGGGHAWPGQLFTGPNTGNVNEDISANEEIWNFFKDQSRVLLSTTSTSNIEAQSSVSIYPNPFQQSLTVESAKNEQLQSIEILDLWGRTHWMADELSQSGAFSIADLQALPKGYYLVKIRTDKGIFMQQVVKSLP
ncbi:MAG: T9SS type A sorting domain-containing protein [Bacteroidota bacterium]